MIRNSTIFGKDLFDVVRTIHAHDQGLFHDRVFRALDRVFEGSQYALELFGNEGVYAMETTLPFHECKEPDILQRTAVLVQEQSPMFHQLAAGNLSTMRLSDFISQRELRKTDLYNEIFSRIGIRHQIGIPIQSSSCLGGLTINRDRLDYRDEDVAVASILAGQIATAFEVDVLLKSLGPEPVKQLAQTDFTKLRRFGLSRREAEAMFWVMEGKRDGEIAVILGLSIRTVQQHVGAILRKLKVETRTAAAALILKAEALRPPLTSSKN